MNDFITKFLAEMLERFKTSNPKTFAVSALVVLTLTYSAQQGTLLGLYSLPEAFTAVIKWVGPLLGTLISTSTFKFLSPKSQAARKS